MILIELYNQTVPQNIRVEWTWCQCAHPVQFAHIQTVGGQFFDRQSGDVGCRITALDLTCDQKSHAEL
jgi:hypothetical protein